MQDVFIAYSLYAHCIHVLHVRTVFGSHYGVLVYAGEVKAAIVTCGGLCPGLNDVVQELVRVLYCTCSGYGVACYSSTSYCSFLTLSVC